MTGYAIRLDYHDGALAHPLLGAVKPVLDAAPALPARVRAHWSGGHHLAVLLPEAASRADVTAVTDSLAHWVAGAPSAGTDPAAFAVFAAAQARAEGRHGPVEPLGTDNQVRIQPHDEPAYLGSPAIAEVRAVFERDTVRPLLALLAAGPAPATARLQLMLAEVACAYRDGGAANGVRSLRAHGHNFLAAQPALEARFEAAYRQAAPALAGAIAPLLAGEGPDDAFSAALTAAGERLDHLAGAGEDVARAGVHRLAEVDTAGSYTVPDALARWLSPQVINGAPEKRRAFGRHRVLVNLVYAQCPVLGINPIARFACAYLAYRALADALGLADATLQPSRKVA